MGCSYSAVSKIFQNASNEMMFLIYFLQSHVWLMVGCGFILLHLCYYIISYNISLLRTDWTTNCASRNNRYKTLFSKIFNMLHLNNTFYFFISSLVELDRLKENRYLFGLLCQATIELNHIFSLPALLTISTRLVTSVCNLFSIISQIIKPNPFFESMTALLYASFLCDWAAILVFFTSADMPIKQVLHFEIKNLKILCLNMYLKRFEKYVKKSSSLQIQRFNERIIWTSK